MLFNDWGSTMITLLVVVLLAYVIAFVVWGVQPMLRQRYKRQIRRNERVRYVSEVNTDLVGYQVQKNHANLTLASLFMLALVIWRPLDEAVVLGGLVYTVYVLRDLYLQRPFQLMQGVMLTDRGVHLFPERQGQLVWQDKHHLFYEWQKIKGYRIDGSYLQLYDGADAMINQIEYAPNEFEVIKRAMFDLNVQRLEISDRIWVAQLDEEEFYQFEDEICTMGWEMLDLFRDELDSLKLMPEFGVMRNMPGDRLLEEHARSWLQLHLIDEQTGERRSSSSFTLWQSNGNIGFLIGARGQEMVDRLQMWFNSALQEARQEAKEVVS